MTKIRAFGSQSKIQQPVDERWKKTLWAFALATLVVLAGWGTYSFAQGAAGESGETEELETFVPSEEVGVDQAVAFPVDI